jgi:hypothetical protein
MSLKLSRENKSSTLQFIINVIEGDSNYIALMLDANAHDDKKSAKPQHTFME